MTSLKQLSAELERYQIAEIAFGQSTVRLGLVHEAGDDYFIVEASQVAKFQISKDPTIDDLFVIGSASVCELDDHARRKLLSDLGLRFGTVEPHVRYHLKIDGDAGLEVLFGHLHILRPVKLSS